MTNIYKENGYDNRQNYLEELSIQYGIPLDHVIELAECLGEEEDFDGLVSGIKDYIGIL